MLGAVEKGVITLIGATTENPSFEVNSALLSRCQVYVLKPLKERPGSLAHHALREDELLARHAVNLKETSALINISGGDARKLLNLLELVVETIGAGNITDDRVMEIAQKRIAVYDKQGEQHSEYHFRIYKVCQGQ